MKVEVVLQHAADPKVYDADTREDVTAKTLEIVITPNRKATATMLWPGQDAEVVRISAAGTWTAAPKVVE